MPFGAPKLLVGLAAGVRSCDVLSKELGRDADEAPSEFRCKNDAGGGFADGLAPVKGIEPRFDGGDAFFDAYDDENEDDGMKEVEASTEDELNAPAC